jgi:hypothetical protein
MLSPKVYSGSVKLLALIVSLKWELVSKRLFLSCLVKKAVLPKEVTKDRKILRFGKNLAFG